ncbi:glycosyltransferase [Prauserella cavernicola]|uniref:Glycosyltransferase n=1 Tax=Prauserella cavernicola TaxID=2800127 RepID=A0A934V5K3_9PSEU|nr:glycosyltransferase [Prauserella cavernicola]MBK1786597.1 glycosyltransferase [Prauserella cavernicola]
MRVSLVVLGSRGDVQPFIALGRTLRDRGHTVTLATHQDFAGLVEEAELGFFELPGSPRDFLAHPALAEALQQGASLFRAARKVPRPSKEQNQVLAQAVAAAAKDADLVLNTILSRIPFEDDGTKPWGSLSWWPLNPTSRWPAMMAPQVQRGPVYNRVTHWVAGVLNWLSLRAYRSDAGLPALPVGDPYRELGRDVPLLCPVTREMFTEPPDWPALSHVTGYWFWDREWTPPKDLEAFVEDGPAPVTLSFGSIWPVYPPAETLAKVLSAVRAHGRKLVLIGGPKDVPSDVFRITDVHYPWLFPRSSVVVHHGGCNTTGDALRSGTAQVVVPTFADSPFWAAQVRRLGVSPDPVPYAKFTAEKLETALGQALGDDSIRKRADEIGTAIRAEDGVGRAADIVERWHAQWHERHGPRNAPDGRESTF